MSRRCQQRGQNCAPAGGRDSDAAGPAAYLLRPRTQRASVGNTIPTQGSLGLQVQMLNHGPCPAMFDTAEEAEGHMLTCPARHAVVFPARHIPREPWTGPPDPGDQSAEADTHMRGAGSGSERRKDSNSDCPACAHARSKGDLVHHPDGRHVPFHLQQTVHSDPELDKCCLDACHSHFSNSQVFR